ncbi:MAG: ABC transporter substrate-binding protein [Desulfovibrio sp.]|nr:ABC transporter substrate-binding protein [Desulfovibrio sp.]
MKKRLSLRFCVLVMTFLAFGLVSTSSMAAPAKKEKITFAAGRPDDAWFALSHGLAKMINERSEWLEAEVIATAGIGDATRLAQRDPEKRKNHIVITMTPGMELWATPEYTTKKVGSMGMLSTALVTLNPEIKTWADLKGKTIALPRKVKQSYTHIYIDMLRQAGILDSVQLQHGGTSACLTALRDGAADAGAIMISFIFPDSASPGPFLEQLQTRGPVYFIEQGNIEKNIAMMTEAGKQKEFEGATVPPLAMVAAPSSFGPTQTQPVVIMTPPVFWAAGTQVPDEIIYEVTRIMYEAAEKGEFGQYHVIGKGMTPEFIVTSFWPTEEECRKNYHPGALKYFDERGIRLRSVSETYAKK